MSFLFRKLVITEAGNGIRILVRAKSSWDIITGVCVERLPVVTPALSGIHKKASELFWTFEVEKSLKSDHELRLESDKKLAQKLKMESADVDIDAMSKITGQDFEDSSNEELAQFKFAPIETEADKSGDNSTHYRQLQRHLILVTPILLGDTIKTLLPQGQRKEGETLRQTAERIVVENFGSNLKVRFLSNAPCGFYKYKYPNVINGKVGAKVFFYYANHEDGEVNKDTKASWLTRTEMGETLPGGYNKLVQRFLIQESF